MSEANVRSRVSWAELCADVRYHHHWVALDDVRYEDGNPLDGQVVDVDADLAALCARVQSADQHSCAILYCDDKASGIRRVSLSG
jgi:hypothetical protein